MRHGPPALQSQEAGALCCCLWMEQQETGSDGSDGSMQGEELSDWWPGKGMNVSKIPHAPSILFQFGTACTPT